MSPANNVIKLFLIKRQLASLVDPILSDAGFVKVPGEVACRTEHGSTPHRILQLLRLLLLVLVQRVAECLLAIPEREQDVAHFVSLWRVLWLGIDLGLRFRQPAVPLLRLWRDVGDPRPLCGARDGDRFPKG